MSIITKNNESSFFERHQFLHPLGEPPNILFDREGSVLRYSKPCRICPPNSKVQKTVMTYFAKLNEENKVICVQCDSIISITAKSFDNARSHLRNMHPELVCWPFETLASMINSSWLCNEKKLWEVSVSISKYDAIELKNWKKASHQEDEAFSKRNNNILKRKKKTHGTETLSKIMFSQSKNISNILQSETLIDTIIMFLALAVFPISVIYNPGIIYLFTKLFGCVPSGLSPRNIVRRMYELYKLERNFKMDRLHQLNKNLNICFGNDMYLSLQHDHWKSRGVLDCSYYGIACSIIDISSDPFQWKIVDTMLSAVPHSNEKHTLVNNFNVINNLVQAWKFNLRDNFYSSTMDNAPNSLLVFDVPEAAELLIVKTGCFGHRYINFH